MTDTPSTKGAISRASSQAAAAEADLAERADRRRKARLAVGAEAEAARPVVMCRVLPLGDGKISQGKHAPGPGEAYYTRGEDFIVTEDIGQALEAAGFAQILPDTAPAAGAAASE